MPISSKAINALDERDLQALVHNQVMESRTLEYKEALPDSKAESRHKFLAAVSAFANTLGGDLIYGIREDAGVACEVCGLEADDSNAECLRLEDMLRAGLDPRVSGVRIKPIPLVNNRIAILLRIPRSWAQPHIVNFNQSSKFYGRNSNGKYQMDVRQIRDAFLLTEAITDRIRAFRHQRLNLLSQGTEPIALNNPKRFLALHIMPIEAFSLASQFDVNLLYDNYPQPLSMLGAGASASSRRLNFDGLLSFENIGNRASTNSYIQTFRNGIIEAVDTGNMITSENAAFISPEYEPMVIAGLRNLLAAQKKLGVEPPLLIGLTLTGVKNHVMAVRYRQAERIDRDNLLVPEVVVEDYDVRLVDLMKPAFDAIWNASGLPQSTNYDENGIWRGGNV